MASFKDKNGTSWSVNMTVGHLTPLKEIGFDVSSYIKSDAAFASIYDLQPQDIVSALWVVCEEAAEKNGITPEAFAHLFDGESMEGGINALADACLSFFPRKMIGARMRSNLKSALERMDQQILQKMDQKEKETTASITS